MAFFKNRTDGNFYGWIKTLLRELRRYSTASFELPNDLRKMSLHADSIGNGQVSLYLCRDSVSICELGKCRIECRSEEEMQQNLRPLFFRLCIYAFLRVTHKNIMDLKKLGKAKESISNTDIETLMEVDIGSWSIEASIYKQVFNELFYAACYFHLYRDSETESKELAAKTLKIIPLEAADSLMRSLASKSTEILLEYRGENINGDFKISYCSSLDGIWTIRCYCSRLSMKEEFQYKKMDSHLNYALSHQLLDCTLRFHHDVRIHTDLIEVEIYIHNLHCKAVRVNSHNPIQDKLKQERYIPAKITVTMGPETTRLLSVNPGASSSNPVVNYSESSAIEGGIQAQFGSAKVLVGGTVKHTSTKTTTSERRNWYFEPSAQDNIRGRFQWTLYHHSYQKNPVFSYHSKRKCCKYKAFKKLARSVWPNSPFTEEGGVEFAGDKYGTPIQWTFHRMKKVKTIDWFIEWEIWMAYYSSKCMEMRSQKFSQRVQLPIKRSWSLRKELLHSGRKGRT